MSARKPAYQLLADDKELRIKKIKELDDIIKSMNIDDILESLDDERDGAHKVLASIVADTVKAREVLDEVLSQEKQARGLLSDREGLIRVTEEKHRDISRRLFLDLAGIQKQIDAAAANLEGIRGSTVAAERRLGLLEDEIDKKQERSLELDMLNAQKSELLGKAGKDLEEAIEELALVRQDSKSLKDDGLAMAEDRRELGIQLHDARVYKMRAGADFQKIMKEYLDKRYG